MTKSGYNLYPTALNFYAKGFDSLLFYFETYNTNLIKEKLNVEVSPSQIILKNNLDKIGVYRVDINFHSEVKAQISIKINKIQSK